jgi:hypothetical protein
VPAQGKAEPPTIATTPHLFTNRKDFLGIGREIA